VERDLLVPPSNTSSSSTHQELIMKTAADVMNRKFFHASPSDTIGVLLQEMAERGLGSVPVLDLEGRPVGVATTGEIERCYDMEELVERLQRTAVCMDQGTPIDVAARTLALHPSCALILLNGSGVAVGALSPLELLRAVLGLEAARPAEKLHEGDASWDEAEVLDVASAHRAPESPGIVLLSPGLDASKKRVVWAEASTNMRQRLDQMLREPQDDEGLEAILEVYPRSVRFRCLTMHDESQREEVAGALCNVGDGAGGARPAGVEPDGSPRAHEKPRVVAPSAALGS
jgi:CBS domain